MKNRNLKLAMSATALACLALVAGCGGGGTPDSGTSMFPSQQDQAAAKAQDLAIVLSANTLPNDGASVVTADITALDANRQVMAGIPVTVKADQNAILEVSGAVTDANGVVTVTVSPGADLSNRAITLTAVAGALTKVSTVQVTGAKLDGNLPGSLTAGQQISTTFTLRDAASKAMALQPITISTVSGTDVVGKTDINGQYLYKDTVPASLSGVREIKVASAGATLTQSINIQPATASVPLPTVAVVSSSVSSSAAVVPVNLTDDGENSTEVRALFLGSGNTPAENVRVRFDLDGDVNAIGGAMSTGSTVVYSDSTGAARSTYRAGTRSGPTNGMTLRACWDVADFDASVCPNEALTKITVASEPLSVSIGSSGSIADGASEDYIQRYVVQVVDSAGRAKPDVLITPSVDLTRYLKGHFYLAARSDGTFFWAQSVQSACDNEDLNRNGVSEILPGGIVEDINASYDATTGRPALEPRKADMSVSVVGSDHTDGNGQVVLEAHFPRNVASWVDYNILVSAAGISGTEGRANLSSRLGVPASAINADTVSPPFVLSPYGDAASPVSAVNYAGKTSYLCLSKD